MTIFNVRYTPNGINIYNYDYNYDHMFIFYTKRQIEKTVREALGLKYKRGFYYMYSRKQLNKMNNLQVLLIALLKFYFYICFDALLFGLFLGLSNIVLPLIYN